MGAEDAAGAGDGGTQAAPERAVVEPDVVRLEGDLLFVLNQYRGLSIVDLSGSSPEMLGTAPTYGFPRDMYVRDDRAYVLVSNAFTYTQEGDTLDFEMHTQLFVVDVSDPEQPEIVGRFNLEGDLVDSRLVGDVLYSVTRLYPYYYYGGGVGVAVPEGGTRGEEPVATDQDNPVGTDPGGPDGTDPDEPGDSGGSEPGDTGEPGGAGQTDTVDLGETVVTSVNVANPADIQVADEVRFEGTGQIIHATSHVIYVASTEWDSFDGSTQTAIQYVDIDDPNGDIIVRDTVNVTGYVEDRFKLDEYDGVLRVVSYSWENFRTVYITTVDVSNPDALSIMAETELEGAEGETLFATRFDGPRGYIVTYLFTDPLFVIDFSDPFAPEVVGELIIPGWSTHIEPYGERLIALGVDDTDGTRRVKVSLFDVSDPANPGLADDPVSFGEDWAWSSAFSDVKAFTILEDEGLILVPFSGYSSETGTAYDRLQLIEYTLDTLTLRGAVDVQGNVRRSLAHSPDLLAVTTEQLVVIDPSNLDEPVVVSTLQLAENVIDFVPLTDTLGAQIIADYDSSMTVVQTVALPLNGAQPIGEVSVDVGFQAAAFGSGTTVILVGTDYDEETYEGFYRVAAVDCSNPSAPSITSELVIEVEPFWGFYWGPFVDVAFAQDVAIAPCFGCFGFDTLESAFLVADTLVLRTWLSDTDTTDVTFGTSDIQWQEGLALVDASNLSSLRSASTIRLAYYGLASVDTPGNGYIYLSTIADAGETLGGYPLVAYFVAELDVSDPDEPDLGPSANVPGIFLEYDRGAGVLTLQDQQWRVEGDVAPWLRTASWDGGNTATPLDSRQLPIGVWRLVPTRSHVFFDRYVWEGEVTGIELSAATVDSSGQINFSAEDAILVTPQYGSLLGATGNHALMQVGGGAVARYDFSGTSGSLGEYFEVTGYPYKVIFSDAGSAYLPLGYFGLEEIALE